MTFFISSPRKGTELAPRVFGTWQGQVEQGLRSFRTGAVLLNFGSVPAHGEVVLAATSKGAKLGASVTVTPVAGPPAGVVFDGFVSAANIVNVRAVNITASPVVLVSTHYQVEAVNVNVTDDQVADVP
jgi:hypothetical protein